MKKFIPLMILCSHCVAMHGHEISEYSMDSYDECRNAPCTMQDAVDREDRFREFKEEHRLSDED